MADVPKRIQRKRSKGSKMPQGAVYVGRPGPFGNPFHAGQDGSLAECVDLHRDWLTGALSDDAIRERFIQPNAEWLINMRHPRLGKILRELPGKNLACWCPLVDKHGKPVPCHAGVLLELANEEEAA